MEGGLQEKGTIRSLFLCMASGIRAVQMENFRGLLGIGRMDRIPNARIRELCRVKRA